MRKIFLGIAGLLLCAHASGALSQSAGVIYRGPAGTDVPAQGVFLNDGSSYYTETTTALAAAGTFTGVTRNTSPSSGGVQNNYARHVFFVAEVWTDQAGTLFVEKSTDGGQTWRPVNGTAGTAVAAGVSVQVAARITAGAYRARYVNGATLQGGFVLTTALTNS